MKAIETVEAADLKKLPQVQNAIQTDESGPTLMSVLQLAGVTDFTQITIDGFVKGGVATAELTLTKAQVTDGVMLALVTRGTAKLTGGDIGAARSIIDVNKLVIK